MFVEGWENFYLLIGSAAGALIGLLFVVATLNNRVERSKALRGTMLYMTPIVFHFAMIVVMSAVAMVPHLAREGAGGATSAWAFVGLVHGAVILTMFRLVRSPGQPHWSDIWFYAVAPTVIYAAMAGASWTVWSGNPWAQAAIAAILVSLLMLCVRNAWDLVTWLAPMPELSETER